MEVIELSGYVVRSSLSPLPRPLTRSTKQHSEKLHIAKRYLLPKQLTANSLNDTLVHMSDEALIHLITSYTHEAGVRSLERELGAVCRAKAVEYAEAKDRAREKGSEGVVGVEEVKKEGYEVEVTAEDVERFLGVPKYDREELEQENVVGVSTGLAYQVSWPLVALWSRADPSRLARRDPATAVFFVRLPLLSPQAIAELSPEQISNPPPSRATARCTSPAN